MDYAAQYLNATNVFLDLVKTLSDDQMKLVNADGWTPRHFIHHLADSEAQSYARLRRLIAEPNTTIQGYDENIWANNQTLAYGSHEIASALAVYKAVRQASYELLLRLDESLLDNKGTHTESGEYSVRDWIRSYTNHPIDHANQIKQILGK